MDRESADADCAIVSDLETAVYIAPGACQGPAVHPSRCLLDPSNSEAALPTLTGPRTASWRAALRLIRPQQWSKNLLLLVPLVVGHRWTDEPRLMAGCMVFAAFCCCASAIYIFNDLMDLESDRCHSSKRRRPLASGEVSLREGIRLLVLLLTLGFAISFSTLPLAATGMLSVYLGLTVIYSLHLKKQPIVDVFLLAFLYTLRIFAGGIAVRVPISGWLMAFSIFFFLSLALVKRYSELLLVANTQQHGLDRRGYVVEDLDLIRSLGPASGYMAILTFCLYINAPSVFQLYSCPELLWGVSLVLFFWITRIWFLANRSQLKEDPVEFAIRDPASYFAGLVILTIVILAANL